MAADNQIPIAFQRSAYLDVVLTTNVNPMAADNPTRIAGQEIPYLALVLVPNYPTSTSDNSIPESASVIPPRHSDQELQNNKKEYVSTSYPCCLLMLTFISSPAIIAAKYLIALRRQK
jgi:hypothetical protein